jgi:hypothetical protein
MGEPDILYQYYLEQAGSGIGPIYSGPLYQSGHGIGSFLAKIFRTVSPYLRRSARRVGRELLRTGKDVLDDLGNDMNLKESLENRSREAFKRVISGGSYKFHPFRNLGQIKLKRRGVRKRLAKPKSKRKNTRKKSLRQKPNNRRSSNRRKRREDNLD